MAKKILIVCYYFPPNGVIPSWRPYSWANHFSAQGYETHVVCRYWKGGEVSWDDQTKGWPDEKLQIVQHNDHCTIHYLPTNKSLQRLLRTVSGSKILSKFFFFSMYSAGYLQSELDTFFSFKKYIRETFEDDFDYVIVSAPPMNLVRLGALLRSHFTNAFFIADFRDLWDNGLLSSTYKPGKKQAYLNRMAGGYMKRWLKKFDLATSVCQPILDVVSRYSTIPTAVFTNGYETSLFSGLVKNKRTAFTITSVGTIYAAQNYSILTAGIVEFVQRHKGEPIQVNIIGARPYNETFCKGFEDHISADQLLITGRLDRVTALQYVKDADVLFYPGWPELKGMYSGKIFEYLGSFNNVLIAPGDQDVIEALLTETGAGVSKENAAEVCAQLEIWYAEWKQYGAPLYRGDTDKIKQYSREAQAAKLERKMLELGQQFQHKKETLHT